MCVDTNQELLARLIEITAPGGTDLVALMEAYFDESGDGDGTFLCVAGYLFEKDKCVQLDADWAATLKRFNLPYFRMSACAHGTEPFDRLSKDERIEVSTEMIGHIKKHSTHGVFISVNEKELLQHLGSPNIFGAAYSWCCFMCLVGVENWADDHNFHGDIAYFFEAGHEFQRQANALMDEVCKAEQCRREFRYASHAFVDKVKVRPVQTGDILAWQGATHHKRKMRGLGIRGDFRSLLECDTRGFHATAETLKDFQSYQDTLPDELKALIPRARES